ncbi:hypothetical protein CBS147332_1291 [Penicillium roqueforti]|nr:hypothetical protein CBS147332_1291 [Penicillium roqueforti]KAI3122852.1 hypothetical protein CBS147331_1302 [Penicillium roqueforti]
MSQYPPTRPWAALSSIDRDHESGLFYEDDVPHTAKMTVNMSQPDFEDRGPSMAENLRVIAERSAARRNGTAMNKNDMFSKPLPPIPQQEAPQSAATVGQEGVVQGSGDNIDKMSIHYVLYRSNMHGRHDQASFAQREASQIATQVGQKAVANGCVHSSEKIKLNLLLDGCKLEGYDDETPSIQPSGSEPTLPPLSYHSYNTQATYANSSSAYSCLAQEYDALYDAPASETPDSQVNPSPYRNGDSPTSWYESSPTCYEFSPGPQIALVPNATPVHEIKEENQFADLGATIDELLALINPEKEYSRLANDNHSPESSSSAYHFTTPSSVSTDIYHADQYSSLAYQAPDFVIRDAESPASPDTIRGVTPASPAWSPPSPCPKGCCYWSSDDEATASPEPQFDREWSASDVSLQESPMLPSLPHVASYPSSERRASYLKWREERAHMISAEEALVPRQLNVMKKATFTMDVPIHNVSQHQAAVHTSDSTDEGPSRAASFVSNYSDVSNTISSATLSPVTRSPDVSSSEGSVDSRGIKRKRFTKTLFGKKGYLDDYEGRRDTRFRFFKEAIERGHSTFGNIKGMFWDENRGLISPSTKPSIVTENTAPITLNTEVQSILYAEIEGMITHAANEFLMKEYYDGHLSTSSLQKVKRRWEKKHMPGVPEFRFDQGTQYRIISANREHLNFGRPSNGLGRNTVLGNWKRIWKNMSIRTFVSPDSVIKKNIHDIMDLLELLNAREGHLELLMALDAHVRGQLQKHEMLLYY